MIISGLIKQATLLFKNAGIESAGLDAVILLETALGKSREYIITHSENEVAENVEKQFEELVARRLKREPVAHITGKKEFYGREFKVSADVLTPRPETELIIEAALELYPRAAEINVLDLGTGSGCILLTLLAELPNARGVGVDASNSALAIARENAYNLGIANAEFIESDWCKNLDALLKFHLVVSNPPYIPQPEKENLAAELGFEPQNALFGGDDGLECYKRIAGELSGLNFDLAIFEIGINQQREIEKIFDGYQIKLKQTLKDLAGIVRVMVFTKQ